MRNVIITALATTIIAVSFNANARFSIKIEYELMQKCVQDPWFFDRKVEICACAMEYSGKKGYSKNKLSEQSQKKFIKSLKKNIERCKR
jgi:hypothetical protein